MAMRRQLEGLVLGLVIALVGVVCLVAAPIAQVEESLGLHWLFHLRGPIQPPRDVVVVAIDEESAQNLRLPDKPRDWPRNLHAELVRYLAKAGARVVTFDLTFDTPGLQEANDREFAAALSLAGNVLLATAIRKETLAVRGRDGEPIGSALIENLVPPTAMFEQAALGHAPFLLPKASRVSAYWPFRNGTADAPTLPALALHVFSADAFGELLQMTRQAAPGASIPALVEPSKGQPPDLRLGQARAVREALLADPSLRARLLQGVHERSDRDLDSGRKRLATALVNLYASNETSYLNFYGPPRSIETVSYFRVIEAARLIDAAKADRVDGSVFRDKAVFVGFSPATEAGQAALRDDYRTVYSRSSGHDLSGVEIAATAFSNALDGLELKPAALPWQLAVAAAWGLLLGVLCRSMLPIRAIGVVAVLTTLFLWVVYQQFADSSAWWPSIVPVAVQMPLALFAGVWLDDRASQRERAAIKRAFAQFLPSKVVDELARNVGPITTPNRVVFGACLSTDAEQYTALAESTEPGALAELMNSYYAGLFVPVERTGGVVIDVVGDAMVAIWAGAKSDADLRISACQSALEICTVLDRASDPNAARPSLPTRLGLHAGQMLVGTVGASNHFEYRAVGDIVNTASRIQGLNKVLGTRLLASAAALEGLEQFATRPLGSFLLVGKSTRVAIVEIVGRTTDITARQETVLKSFADALELYRSQNWAGAADCFEELLRTEPEDGPARFYRDRCRQLAAQPPDEAWTPTIRLNVK